MTEDNGSKNREEDAGSHPTRGATIDKMIEDIQTKLNAHTQKDTL